MGMAAIFGHVTLTVWTNFFFPHPMEAPYEIWLFATWPVRYLHFRYLYTFATQRFRYLYFSLPWLFYKPTLGKHFVLFLFIYLCIFTINYFKNELMMSNQD